MQGKWLSILEYANHKGKSISTVRRYVKSNRVKTKEENGKYFIYVENFLEKPTDKKDEIIERLRNENKNLKNQLNEAMMLIELYEQGKFLKTNNPPELPVIL